MRARRGEASPWLAALIVASSACLDLVPRRLLTRMPPNIQRRFSSNSSARASSCAQRRRRRDRPARRRLSAVVNRGRDLLPLRHLRQRRDALELRAERGEMRVVRQHRRLPGAAPRRKIAGQFVEAHLLLPARRETRSASAPPLCASTRGRRPGCRRRPSRSRSARSASRAGSGAVAHLSCISGGSGACGTRRRSTAR